MVERRCCAVWPAGAGARSAGECAAQRSDAASRARPHSCAAHTHACLPNWPPMFPHLPAHAHACVHACLPAHSAAFSDPDCRWLLACTHMLACVRQVLNYGQSIFEGMKAHRSAAGRLVLFRPRDNAQRFHDGERPVQRTASHLRRALVEAGQGRAEAGQGMHASHLPGWPVSLHAPRPCPALATAASYAS